MTVARAHAHRVEKVRVLQVLAAVDVGHFVEHVEAHLIAHLEQTRMRRIVRSADEVDVAVADEFEIAPCILVGGHATLGPDFVMIDAAQFDRRAVQLEDAILDRDLPQSDSIGVTLHGLATRLQIEFETVKRRRLRRPKLRLWHDDARRATPLGERQLELRDGLSVRRNQPPRNIRRRARDDL
jgi:hypothetical protein